jgi:hypothetical protein
LTHVSVKNIEISTKLHSCEEAVVDVFVAIKGHVIVFDVCEILLGKVKGSRSKPILPFWELMPVVDVAEYI